MVAAIYKNQSPLLKLYKFCRINIFFFTAIYKKQFPLQIDMNSHLEDQGPFDLILHKVTALYAQALNNNQKVYNISKCL